MQAQAWICPICFDDHGGRDCKPEDLKAEIERARARAEAAEGALAAVRALHRETTMTGVGRACVEGECEHPQCYDGRSEPPEKEFRVCAHCMSLAEETGVTDEWWPSWVMWPCSTITALATPTTTEESQP